MLRKSRILTHLYQRGVYAHLEFAMLSGTDQNHPKQRAFTVHYHVRGRRKRQPLTTRCDSVQEIIALGQQSFPAFSERNPWICIDSKHATVFVGLDPEIPDLKRTGVDDDRPRNLSAHEESTQG